MDILIKQAPPNISNEQIEEVYIKNNKDFLKTLNELWGISETIPKEKNKWDNMREICDSFDVEMDKMMKSKNQKS